MLFRSLKARPNGTIAVSGRSLVASIYNNQYSIYNQDTVVSTCLMKGCYSATLRLDPTYSYPSTAAAISTCNVFLAPLRTTQLFCIKDPVLTKVGSSASGDVLIPIFPAKPCYSVCERQPHINFNAILSEDSGNPWGGAYYAITPMIYGLDLSGAYEAYLNRTLPGVLKGAANVSAVAAGSLFWRRRRTASICLPVPNYNIPNSRSLSVDAKKDQMKDEVAIHLKENVKQLQGQGQSMAPTCFSILLSQPFSFSFYSEGPKPKFSFANSWSIPDGKDYFSGTAVIVEIKYVYFHFARM